jgi:phosphoribosyl-ATP pyrophosphohydrolase/phosphoribosyl-AMP cyclohydrolase
MDKDVASLGSVDLEALRWSADGLLPAVVQDANTRQVLMVAWVNRVSLERCLETSETWFWSRSRQCLWHKGATSGNIQRIQEILVDCDADTLLVLVSPAGPACHTGAVSCFYRRLGGAQERS